MKKSIVVTNKNIAKIFNSIQKFIEKKYGNFLGFDKYLRPVYSKDVKKLKQ